MADETKIVGIKVTADTSAGVKSMRNMEDASTSLLGGIKQLDKGVAGFQSAVTTVAQAMGAIAFANYARSAVDAANQMDRAVTGLAITARYTGVAMDEANKAAKALSSDGLMSVAESSKALQNLLGRGFSLDESIRLMNGFKDSAAYGRQASLQFGESVVSATEGLKNENSILVDNAGVTKNVSVMWKEYAAQHGTTADKLTQSQKRHAELNGILKETEGQVGNSARMMDSFAGSQAKAAQQSFELKAAFGTGLQPVIKATLDILGPVVSGLKDMVYWTETLGASAGATYDKLAARIKSGYAQGIFSEKARAEYDAAVKVINQNRDEVIAEVVNRSMGDTLPEVGRDSGKRRTDTVIPPKTGAGGGSDGRAEAARIAREAELALNAAMEVGTDALTAYHKELQDIADIRQQMADSDAMADVDTLKGSSAWRNPLGLLGTNVDSWDSDQGPLPRFSRDATSEQDRFDRTSMQGEWATRNAASDRAAKQQQDSFSAALAAQNGDGGYEQRILAIDMEAEHLEQSWAMQTDSFEVYQSRMTQIEDNWSKRRIQNKQNEERTKLQLVANGAGQTGDLMLQLHNLIGKRDKVAFRAFQGAKSAQTIVSTATGVMDAWADKTSSSWYEKAAKAAFVAATGAVQLGVIWGADPEGGSGAGGASSGATSPGGTYNPVVTQPSGASAQQQGNVTIQIAGNVIGEDRWVEENLVPALNQAGSRGVTIQYVN